VKQPSQEELLGYVLGALDAQEQRNVQQLIDQNPDLEEQLLEIRNSLLPLDCLDTAGPRPGMARRTCEMVAGCCQSNLDETDFSATLLPGRAEHVEPKLTASKPNERFLLQPSSWSLPDFVMAVGLMAIVAGILFPTISYTRFNSRLLACQNNMRELGTAFMQYSETNCGYFPEIASNGNMSTNGCYAPMLKDCGLVNDDKRFACAGLGSDAPPVYIPRIETIKSASGARLSHLKRTMGHYGYTMGYCDEHGSYCPPQNHGRANVVLLADMPSLNAAGRVSANHNGWGQNCLFEDGHVSFVRGDSIGNDAIFVNDYNMVAPGCRAADNVIAPSHLSPAKVNVISIEAL
jgi:hypothetical protein